MSAETEISYLELDQFSFIMGAPIIKVAMKPNLT